MNGNDAINTEGKGKFKCEKMKIGWKDVFQAYTGHSARCFESVDKFVDFMFEPTDAASLGVGRMLFGLMMLIDIPDERGGNELDLRYGNPRDCGFPLFHWMAPLRFPLMAITYFIMWIGALGICLGYRYKLSCLFFIIPYWYIFLLDKSVWNNHSYLYGLLGILFGVTEAHRYCSIDAIKDDLQPVVPFWNYFILKFQFFLLYFYAGVKKFSFEWLSGYSMTNLGYHWVFTPFRLVIGAQMTDLLIIHWFSCFFDLSIAFLLVYEVTRLWATPFCIMFHLMNSRLFRIGMFPWTCLVELPLFYKVEWPRRFFGSKEIVLEATESCETCCEKKFKESKAKKKRTVAVIAVYVFIQLFLPFSHFITKGYNSWTQGLYGYSWDMMVHAWDTELVAVKVIDNSNQKIHYLEPYAYTDSDRWTKHPDMAHQYAHCIMKNLQEDFRNGQNRQLKSANISIYFDIWTSMNQRFQQRYFDPNIDLLRAPWHPFKKTPWVLPLLDEFTSHRPRMIEITNQVLSWNNSTDLLFIADLPGLSMDHYIPDDLDNVTLTVLEGTVKHRIRGEKAQIVKKGQHVDILADNFHNMEVIGDTPASYMFSYLNKTMHFQGVPDVYEEPKPILPLRNEFAQRVNGYKQFLAHVGNAILHEVYGVPMPKRMRQIKV